MTATKPARILVVEDEAVVGLDLETRLQRLGYEVVGLVASGREAVEKATALRPDVVLMDIRLEGTMDGIEAATEIQRELDIPIIYLTAYADEETIRRATPTAPYGYVVKPFHERELDLAIATAVFRHDTTQRLNESETWLRATLSSVADAVIATDGNQRVRFLNPRTTELTGWTQDDAAGRELSIVIDLNRSAGSAPTNEAWLTAKDGTQRCVEYEISPIKDRAGAVVGSVLALHDITERQRVLDAERFIARGSALLSRSLRWEELLVEIRQLIIPALADWFVLEMFDGQPAVAHVDEAMVPVLDRLVHTAARGAGAIAEAARDQRAIDLDDLDRGPQLRRALGLAADTPLDGLVARSGHARPLVGRDRGLGAMLLVRRHRTFSEFDRVIAGDVCHRIAAALENARLYREAQQAVRIREDLMTIVSHDLKNPISTIMMGVQLALATLAKGKAEDAKRQLLAIDRSAQLMNRLVGDLLDVGRIESGALTLATGRFDARDVLVEVVEMFEPIATRSSIRLAPALPYPRSAMVAGDHTRIVQALANLIGNAIKFTDAGGTVGLGVEVEPGFVRFIVSDTGQGIAGDELPRIFERYWQASAARRHGSGLGLFIAKGIVEAHGGRIWVESSQGRGSTFFFTVPRVLEVDESVRPVDGHRG